MSKYFLMLIKLFLLILDHSDDVRRQLGELSVRLFEALKSLLSRQWPSPSLLRLYLNGPSGRVVAHRV